MNLRSTSDGWRGVIADTFTFDSLTTLTRAIADFLEGAEAPTSTVVVGYDRRFLSKTFAELAAAVLASSGLQVLLSDDFVPTPALTWNVKQFKSRGGIMISASHNPAIYNGLKLREAYGGPPLDHTVRYINERAELLHRSRRGRATKDFNSLLRQGKIERIDLKNPYLKHLEQVLDLNTIAQASPKVFLDPMHGAGTGYISTILRRCDCEVVEIHQDLNPSFDGHPPEPRREHLTDLTELVRRTNSNRLVLGLANDGDADRLGAIDENGEYFNTNWIIALLLWHLYRQIGVRGNTVKCVGSSDLIRRIAEHHGAQCLETPVGFRYIGKAMLGRNDILLGGEESGGIGFPRHIHDKDGILAGLYLLEACARRSMGPADLLTEINNQLGSYFHGRLDLKLQRGSAQQIFERLQRQRLETILGRQIVRTEQLDGLKYRFEDGSWLLLRPSQTEPLMRIYAESLGENKVEELLEVGRTILRTQ
ncbi:MAG: hypothetical protein A2284_14200 [Deltaproteobacteria bacterium RIFOXYA12_FULL_61_11]|nr:MAG: hypothetical protein A2284_14200 [Deltaproteobacteria bacterium RIFOXYA12_FULL_61_11]